MVKTTASLALLNKSSDYFESPYGKVSVFDVAVLLATVVGIGFISDRIANDFGRYVPESGRALDWGIAAIVGLGLCVVVATIRATENEKRVLVAGWVAKLAATLIFALFYERKYYFLDAYQYQRLSESRTFDIVSALAGNGTDRVAALSWTLHRIPGVGYHGTKVFFSFAGFCGVFAVYRAWCVAQNRTSWRLLAIILFMPSIMWWSSILGKDPLMMLGVGLFLLGVATVLRNRFLSGTGIGLAGLLLAVGIRGWLGPILLAPLAVLVAAHSRRPLTFIVLGSVTIGYFVFGFTSLVQTLGISTVAETLQLTGNIASSFEQAGSNLTVQQDLSTIGGALRFLPLGIFTALVRPLPGEVNNFFGFLAGLEGLAILLLGLAALMRARTNELKEDTFLWFSATVALWAFVYAFISYHNLGSATRYRLQVLPVFIIALLHCARWIKYDDCSATTIPAMRNLSGSLTTP
jgi:hypothetical protein